MPSLLKVCPRIQKVIQEVLNIPNSPYKQKLQIYTNNDDAEATYKDQYISFALLVELSSYMIQRESVNSDEKNLEYSDYWLHNLIRGSKLYIEPKKAPSRKQSVKKLLDSYQDNLNNLEYERMTASINGSTTFLSYGDKRESESVLADFKQVRRNMVLIGNVLLSVFGCFFAFMYLFQYTFESQDLKILVSFLLAMIVGAVEVILYYRLYVFKLN